MRNITTSLVALFAILPAAGAAGPKINAFTNIDWTKVAGTGAPSASCVASIYGMPYTNTTNGDFYVCGSTGWVLVTGGGGGGISGSGAINKVAKFTGTTAIGNSAITDDGTTVTSTLPVNVAVSGGQGGTVDMTEGTAPSAAASHDILYADSTAHCIKQSLNNGSFSCLGTGTGSVDVNGSSVSSPNFNGSTPAAGSNGKNVTWQSSGSSVSAEIVGDGTSTHFLNGIGTYTTPAGGGSGLAGTYGFSAGVNGAACDGTTDDTSALNTLLTTVNTAGGGTIFVNGTCLISGQINVPNDGVSPGPKQATIRITGSGGSANGSWASAFDSPSVLDMRVNATYGKILTLGSGILEIDHLTLKDGGSDCAAFVYTTNTTVAIHDVLFSGTASSTSACNDGVILGGTTTTIATLVETDAFQGYGSYITHNFFDKIRRAAWFRVFANAVNFKDNTISASCGSTNLAAAVEVGYTGSGPQTAGNVFSGNLYETSHYPYVIWLRSSGNQFKGETFWDASGTTLFAFHVTDSATLNIGEVYTDSTITIATLADDNQPSGSNSFMNPLWQAGVGLAAINNRLCNYSSGSGTAQVCASTVTFAPGAGMVILFKTATASTGTGFTLNANGSGAKSVAKYSAGAETTTLTAGDIVAGVNPMWYDSVSGNWVLYTPGNGGGGGGGTTTNALTINNGGSGDASGSTFNGSAAKTISYNSIGALAAASGTFTGTPDASGATQFKLPVGAAFATLANGEQGFDTTNKNWHAWGNAVDNFIAVAPVASPPSNGDCAQWALTGGVLTLGHAAGNCGTSSSSAVTVNGGSTLGTANFNGTTPAAGSNGKNVTFQTSTTNVSAEIVGDGTATHYLDGTGNYSTPAGGNNIPFAIVQESFGNSGAGTSFTLTYPKTAASSGNTEWLIVGTGGTTITTPSGWTLDVDYNPAYHTAIYHRTSNSDTSVTIALGASTQIGVYYVELTGTRTLDTSTTFQTTPTNSGLGTASIPTSTSITPTAGSWIVRATTTASAVAATTTNPVVQSSDPLWQTRANLTTTTNFKELVVTTANYTATAVSTSPPAAQLASSAVDTGNGAATVLFAIK